MTLVCHGDAEQRLTWLKQQKSTAYNPLRLTSPWIAHLSRQQYGEKFQQIQEYLQSSDCYQVKLAKRFSTNYQEDKWLAFLRLSQSNIAPFQPLSVCHITA